MKPATLAHSIRLLEEMARRPMHPDDRGEYHHGAQALKRLAGAVAVLLEHTKEWNEAKDGHSTTLYCLGCHERGGPPWNPGKLEHADGCTWAAALVAARAAVEPEEAPPPPPDLSGVPTRTWFFRDVPGEEVAAHLRELLSNPALGRRSAIAPLDDAALLTRSAVSGTPEIAAEAYAVYCEELGETNWANLDKETRDAWRLAVKRVWEMAR